MDTSCSLGAQVSRRPAAARRGGSWSRSAAGQDAAEAQHDRLGVQVRPEGEAVPTTADKQQLLLVWQKDTAMVMQH